MSVPVISAMGVTSAIGVGKQAFFEALLEGKRVFAPLQREGRQHRKSQFIGAEIPAQAFATDAAGNLSFSTQVAIHTLAELLDEAKLEAQALQAAGLIVGGSNFHQREQFLLQQRYGEKIRFIRPHYGIGFLDSDLIGACSERFGIGGFAYTLGGASASGLMAVIEAAEAVRSGRVEQCIALGALMDLSAMEFQAFRAMSAMGSDRFADQPHLASRPFDEQHDGFIFGEHCAAVLIESEASAKVRGIQPYVKVRGWALALDGNRNPNPSLEGEQRVIYGALEAAGWQPQDVDYVNPHGTGSPLGDDTELGALQTCGLNQAAINATKAITGHGLTSAGTLETVATCLQLRAQTLHPCVNLDHPINQNFNWVGPHQKSVDARTALKLSMGFGGINAAICMEKWSPAD
jgi:malonyl-ACP decarboxylase